MSNKISRRQALTAGAASTGIFLGAGCTSTREPERETEEGPGRESYWGPGADMNVVRDHHNTDVETCLG